VLVGIISDTNGLVRPEALETFRGAKLILHAGDVGTPGVVQALESVAPVIAVRGNVDRGEWAETLPESRVVAIGSARVFLVHDASHLAGEPSNFGFHAVVSGHSHRPSLRWSGGVLFLNPGSAGPRRFRLPVAVALLRVRGVELTPQVVELDPK
jgi:putative phosphoesterase